MRAEIKERIEQIEQGILPKGYKETKVGIIPEEWEVKKLGELGDTFNGLTGKTKDDFGTGKPYITYKSIFDSNKIDINRVEFVNIIEGENQNKIKYGDIFFTGSSETPYEIGMASVLLDEIEDCFLNSFCFGFRLKNILEISPNFMRFYLHSKYARSEISRLAQGSTRYNLSKTKLLKLNFYFPPLQEQEKIASILTQWDSLIEEQEKLIEEKRESFKIITNELINKKRRFPEFKENWKTLKLQEFVTPVVREVKKPNEPYEALGIRSHCKGTFHKFIENPEEVGMDSLYEVKADDLIVNITFAWEHAIAIANSEDEGRLVSHRFPTYEIKKEKIDLQFLRALIRQPRLKYMLGLISPGGAGRNRVLNKKDFLKLEFNLPPLKEQQKIGQFLSKLNEEILLQEEKLTLLREEKKILMQLLLTGIIRV